MRIRTAKLLLFMLMGMTLLQIVFAAPILETLDSALYPFSNLHIDDFYSKYAGLIDIILYIVLFGGITKKVMGEKLGAKAATAIGMILGLSLGIWGAMNSFGIASMGPVAALIFTLILGFVLYHVILSLYGTPNEHHPTAAAFAFLITFGVMQMVVPQVSEFMRGTWLGDIIMALLWLFALVALFRVFIGLWGLLFPPRDASADGAAVHAGPYRDDRQLPDVPTPGSENPPLPDAVNPVNPVNPGPTTPPADFGPIENRLNNIERALSDLARQVNDRFTDLAQRLINLGQSIGQIQNGVNQLQTAINGLPDRIDQQHAQLLQSIERYLNGLREFIVQSSGNLENSIKETIKTTTGALKQDIASLASDFASLKQILSDKIGRLEVDQQQQYKNLLEKVTILEKQNAESAQLLAGLQKLVEQIILRIRDTLAGFSGNSGTNTANPNIKADISAALTQIQNIAAAEGKKINDAIDTVHKIHELLQKLVEQGAAEDKSERGDVDKRKEISKLAKEISTGVGSVRHQMSAVSSQIARQDEKKKWLGTNDTLRKKTLEAMAAAVKEAEDISKFSAIVNAHDLEKHCDDLLKWAVMAKKFLNDIEDKKGKNFATTKTNIDNIVGYVTVLQKMINSIK